jgi:hypothetical protein
MSENTFNPTFTGIRIKEWKARKPGDTTIAYGHFEVSGCFTISFFLKEKTGKNGLFRWVSLPGYYGQEKEGKKQWIETVQAVVDVNKGIDMKTELFDYINAHYQELVKPSTPETQETGPDEDEEPYA